MKTLTDTTKSNLNASFSLIEFNWTFPTQVMSSKLAPKTGLILLIYSPRFFQKIEHFGPKAIADLSTPYCSTIKQLLNAHFILKLDIFIKLQVIMR